MKKTCPSKELLVDWLRTALDYELYPGMAWLDKEKGLFYVKWVHKSSEQWSDDDLAPFKAWAGHKGKLDGKNPKQLKATFRCALNSKKELKEEGRDRDRRYWRFVDPNTEKKGKTPKKRRRNNKVSRSTVDIMDTDACNNSAKSNALFPLRISEDEMSRSAKLPAFDSFSNFEPLTPPDQANENSFTDFKFSKENVKENSRTSSLLNVEHISVNLPSLNVNHSLLENTNEEYRTNCTPPPEQSRLTPPQKSYHNSRDSYNPSSTDLWQPNCWPVHEADKDMKGLSDFFSSDFIGMYKSFNQEPEISNNMDFLDMDQYVPVINTSTIVQIHNKNGQSTLMSRAPSSNSIQTDHSLEKLDDYFLGDDVDPEMCRRLMQEIERTSSAPQYRCLI